MTLWPIAWGLYFPVALKEGGSKRLWNDAYILIVISVAFFVLQPVVYIWYAGPLAASGFGTFTLPFSIFSSAMASHLTNKVVKNIGVQMIISSIIAIVISISCAWIS